MKKLLYASILLLNSAALMTTGKMEVCFVKDVQPPCPAGAMCKRLVTDYLVKRNNCAQSGLRKATAAEQKNLQIREEEMTIDV